MKQTYKRIETMDIKSAVISFAKYILLFIALLLMWTVLYTAFANQAHSMSFKPPMVKPWPTQKYNADWARGITQEEYYQHQQLDEPNTAAAISRWDRLWKAQKVVSSSNKPRKAMLYFAQAKCNNYEGAYDIDVWGVDNYFATPNELESKGKGDCEDYAICKYYALRAAGFKASQINIWSGTIVTTGQEHAVLAVEFGGKEYILDNYYPRIVQAKSYMNRYFQPRHRANEQGFTFF